MSHILDCVPILPAENTILREYLRQLPENVFPFAREFTAKHKPYNYDLFVKGDLNLGDKGLALLVRNPYLFGDPFVPRDNPLFNIPEGAKDITFIPGRLPLSISTLVSGVTFYFKDVTYFFGQEYSSEE